MHTLLQALLLSGLLGIRHVVAYDTWHAIDTTAVVCSKKDVPEAETAANLAKGKPVTCSPDVLNCNAQITDEKLSCASPAKGRGITCRQGLLGYGLPWVQIDLGSAQEFNEVVLYQSAPDCPDDMKSRTYCEWKVEVSTDDLSSSFVSVYETERHKTEFTLDTGNVKRFNRTITARYVRFSSGPNNELLGSRDIPFVGVEVYKRDLSVPPERKRERYSIGIEYTSQMDLGAPHVFTILRRSSESTKLRLRVVDAKQKLVLDQNVTVAKLEESGQQQTDASCTCSNPTLPVAVQSRYGSNYGLGCGDWDSQNCGSLWDSPGSWCCKSWCYVNASCRNAYQSTVLPGQYFSYAACSTPSSQLDTCNWTKTKDPCECKNVSDIMDDRMKSLFPADYGSQCQAWDSTNCELNYKPDQIDTWCCKQWCYVDKTCPHAIPSLNAGMEDKLFWTPQTCTQDSKAISQCPYKPLVLESEENADLCQCINQKMPAHLLPKGAPADYGSKCSAHDATLCKQFYPFAEPDMWCCSSWCWVGEECPARKESTIWPGRYYSDFACGWDVSVVTTCPWSDACKCASKNQGIDTAKFGADYGTSCKNWDAGDCNGMYGNTSFWSNTSRNDWCCQSWCYVNESCPIAAASIIGSQQPYSYAACEDDGTAYSESTNKCAQPSSCGCSGETMPSSEAKLPAGIVSLSSDYGTSCKAHDQSTCALFGGANSILCCQSWCWVDELCTDGIPSSVWPGHFYSNSSCTIDSSSFRNCMLSDACKCIGDNKGVDEARFGADYGKACRAWDSKNCYQQWGPSSTTPDLWNSSGNNDWCCENWCYVSPDCPLADGYGEAAYPYSYGACSATGAKFDDSTKTCPNARRLTEETKVAELIPPMPAEKTHFLAQAEQAEPENCESFFLVDGRSPIELPETYADARSSFGTMCQDEGYDAAICEDATKLVFKGFPEDSSKMFAGTDICKRLMVASAAAMAYSTGADSRDKDAALPQGDEQQTSHRADFDEAWTLASDLQQLLRLRRGDASGSTGGALAFDRTLELKLKTVSSTGTLSLPSEAPVRRTKGYGGYGGYSGYSYSAPVSVRRRTPSRPVAPSLRRRSATSRPTTYDTGFRRRAASAAGVAVTHRRRTTSVTGQTHTSTATGGAPYGYTSHSYMNSNFGGRPPQRYDYGYSGYGAYDNGYRSNMAMYAGGGYLMGSHYGGNHYYGGAGYYHTQHYVNDNQQVEWCMMPSDDANAVVQLAECTGCFAKYGFCESAADCFTKGGCGYTLTKGLSRDDLMQTGFIPEKFTPPLTVYIDELSGNGLSKAEVCPPLTKEEIEFHKQFKKLLSFPLDMFLTLTRVDELGDGKADPAPTPKPACEKNTNYPCRPGSYAGQVGQVACYGDEELCQADTWGELMCFCKQGYCLEGEGSSAVCHESAAADFGRASFISTLALSIALSTWLRHLD
eukprot:TRINITY_DN1270_c0_g1_i4.p1 TRINITY_DN1270_c0_g1~~TRINITY_DN1270_c0_g1_i4.p1  ORF type:complete len:1441 (-),score=192.68 TRINITY_DN1270_c0_g1_i4:180-4502(-)